MIRLILLALCVASSLHAKPNIIYIMADDLGYGDLSCFGQKMVPTPHLDRLASEGMKFTDYYAGCTVCRPSRLALWTGKHMGHTPIWSNADLKTSVWVGTGVRSDPLRQSRIGPISLAAERPNSVDSNKKSGKSTTPFSRTGRGG